MTTEQGEKPSFETDEIIILVLFLIAFQAALLGFFENLIVLISMVKNWNTLQPHHFYTFSICLSDFLGSFVVVFVYFYQFMFESSEEFDITLFFIYFVSYSTSSCGIALTTLDRFWAVVFVFHYYQHASPRIAKRAVFVVWAFSIALLTMYFLIADTELTIGIGLVLQLLLSVPVMIIIMPVVYFHIFKEIRKSMNFAARRGSVTVAMIKILKTSSSSQSKETRDIKRTILLLLTVASYLVCWAPLTAVVFLSLPQVWRDEGQVSEKIDNLFMIGVFVLLLNSVINPFIYALRIKFVKEDVRRFKSWVLRKTDVEGANLAQAMTERV